MLRRLFFCVMMLLGFPMAAQSSDPIVYHVRNITVYTNTPVPGQPIIAVPQRPTLTLVAVPGRIMWVSDAYECYIKDQFDNWIPGLGGELPATNTTGMPLLPGMYRFHARGERFRETVFAITVY